MDGITAASPPPTAIRIDDDDRTATIAVDLRVHRLSAVKKAAYRLAKRCTAQLGSLVDDRIEVVLRFPAGASHGAIRDGAHAFLTELLDQDLREEIAEEVAPMRALILAHAFSKVSLVQPS